MAEADRACSSIDDQTATDVVKVFFRRYGAVLLITFFAVGTGLTGIGYYMGAPWPKAFPGVFKVLESTYKGLVGFWFNAGDAFVQDGLFQVGRLIALIVAAVVGWKAIGSLLDDSLQRQRARWSRGHWIVCGYGELGRTVVHALLDQGNRVVLIERDPDSAVDAVARRGAIIVAGDAADLTVLEDAGVGRARKMFISCGDDNLNASVAASVLEERNRKLAKNPLSVSVHIDDPLLLAQLAPRALTSSTPLTHLAFVNVGLLMAEEILSEEGLIGESPIPLSSGECLVIFGWAPMTEAIVLTLARSAATHNSKPLMVKVVDSTAPAGIDRLHARYSNLHTLVKLDPIADDPSFLSLSGRAELFDGGSPKFRVGFVCTNDDRTTAVVALEMSGAIREKTSRTHVTACVYGQSGLRELLEADGDRRLRLKDVASGLGCPEERLIDVYEEVARSFHETWLEQQLSLPAEARRPAAVPWEALGPIYQQRNYSLVASIADKLRDHGYELAAVYDWAQASVVLSDSDRESIAIREHGRWMEELLDQGWRQGPTDDRHHIHKDLVEWHALDTAAKNKDYATADAMIDVVTNILGRGFIQVVRIKEH